MGRIDELSEVKLSVGSALGDPGRPQTVGSAREMAHLLTDLLEQDETYRHVASDIRIMLTLAEGANRQFRTDDAPLSQRAHDLMQRVETEHNIRLSVLAEGAYSAAEVGDLLGSNSKNSRDKASRLRTKGDLLGVEVDGRVLYPAFQFDASRAALRAGVTNTNQALNAKDDGWAVASWWLSPHPRLDEGVRPADLALEGDADSLAQLVTSALTD